MEKTKVKKPAKRPKKVARKSQKFPKTQDDKTNHPDFILNPSSKKWVRKSGKIGKKLLEEMKNENKSISSYSSDSDSEENHTSDVTNHTTSDVTNHTTSDVTNHTTTNTTSDSIVSKNDPKEPVIKSTQLEYQDQLPPLDLPDNDFGSLTNSSNDFGSLTNDFGSLTNDFGSLTNSSNDFSENNYDKSFLEQQRTMLNNFQTINSHDPIKTTKNIAPSTEKITAEEWAVLSNLEPNIMKLALQIMTEETIKYEAGNGFYPFISYVISLAKDRIKEEKRQEEETKRQKEEEIKLQEEEKEKIWEDMSKEEKKKIMRERNLSWIENLRKREKDQEM